MFYLQDVCHRETLVDVRGTYIYDNRYCSSQNTCPGLGNLFTERTTDSSTYTNYCNKIPDKCPVCPDSKYLDCYSTFIFFVEIRLLDPYMQLKPMSINQSVIKTSIVQFE